MEDTNIIYEIPEKRRLWVSIILSILKPGLPMIYCGRLRQGIIVELVISVVVLVSGILLALIPEFYILLIFLFIALSIFFGLLAYNIMLTIKTNRQEIPRLKRTWGLILLVGLVSWILDEGASLLIKKQFVEAYNIPAGSMENTLLIGDYFMVTKNINPDKI